MRFLPIVERELRVASRRASTYFGRAGVAAGMVFACGWIMLIQSHRADDVLGRVLFAALTVISMTACFAGGLRTTADCLSEEKREGTLGLLFLTNLRGHDVVLGKLVANSLRAFYSLLAVVPVLAVPLLLGGVTGREVTRVAFVLVNTLFFSVCVGMFASAAMRGANAAQGLATGVMVFFSGLLPLAAYWIQAKTQQHADFLYLPAAWYPCYKAFEMEFVRDPRAFYVSSAVIHALAWLFLSLSFFIVPRSWQDKPAGPRGLNWQERRAGWRMGDRSTREEFRGRLLGINPFYWLAARERGKPVLVWCVLIALALGWAWGALRLHKDWLNPATYVATALLLNIVLKNWLASEAVQRFCEDRRSGALELILSTPMSVKEILRGQHLALARQFFGPTVAVLCIETALMIAGMPEHGDEATAWICVSLAGMAMLVADLVALSWVAMWCGLSSATPRVAVNRASFRVLMLPWLVWAGWMTLQQFSGSWHTPTWWFFLGAWAAMGLVADAVFAVNARRRLLRDFRVMAAARFERRVPWWQRRIGADDEGNFA